MWLEERILNPNDNGGQFARRSSPRVAGGKKAELVLCGREPHVSFAERGAPFTTAAAVASALLLGWALVVSLPQALHLAREACA
jgi:hypothetical protein